MGLQKRLTIYGAVGLIALAGFFTYLALDTVRQVNDLIYQERLDRAQEIAQHIGEIFIHVREEAEKSTPSIADKWQASSSSLSTVLGSLHGHLRQYLSTDHSLDVPIIIGMTDVNGRALSAEPFWGNRIDVTVPLDTVPLGTWQPRSFLTPGDTGISLMLPIDADQRRRLGYLIVEVIPLAGSFDSFLHSHSHHYQLQVILPDKGTLISSTAPVDGEAQSPDWQVIRALASSFQPGLIKHPAGEGVKPHMAVYTPVPGVPLGVILEDVEGKALALPSTLLQRLLGSTAIALAFMALLAWFVSRRLVRPIEHLAQDAQRIAAGDLETPIPIFGEDEVRMLAGNFERMRQQLKSSLDDMKSWNIKLEKQVSERTQQVQKLYDEVAHREAQCHLLLDKIITAQEDERKRLARELHDETGQFLTGLVLSLKGLEERVAGEPEMVKEHLESLRDLATRATEDVRRLIRDLRPSLLDDMGLVEAIAWYLDNYLEAKGVKCHFETAGFSQRLPAAVESSLFRLVQEAINNIVKHAQAREAWVTLRGTREAISGSIRDNGTGFDLAGLPSGAGTGLLGMQERVKLLGGKLVIKSTHGKGTRIRFEIPLGDGQNG